MGVLRFLLATAVVVFHLHAFGSFTLMDGSTAVQTFFIISGFYMALILNEKYLVQRPFSDAYGLFIRSRLLRLYPVYLVIALTALAVQVTMYYHGIRVPIQDASAVEWWAHVKLSTWSDMLLTATNALIIGQDWIMFTAVNLHNGHLYFTPNFWSEQIPSWHFLLIPQGWSLGTELTFYAIAPYIVRRRLRWLFLIMAISLGIRAALWYCRLDHDPWSNRFFPSQVAFFILGVIGYRLNTVLGSRHTLQPKTAYIPFVLVVVAVSLLHIPHARVGLLLYFILLSVIIPLLFQSTRHNRTDRWLGEVSYPLYISHIATIETLRALGCHSAFIMGSAALTVAFAITILIDHPMERLRRSWIARRTTDASVMI